MATDYGKQLYRQLEEVIKKLEKITKENAELKDTIKELGKIIKEKDEKIEKLLEEIDRLKNNKNKNSTNSSKPSSSNYITPKKKSGANIYNYRVKTNNKIGGQMGHIPHNLTKEKIENIIREKKLKVRKITHIINGNPNKKPIIKYRVGMEIITYVEKHIFKYDRNSKQKLPKEFYTDVTYDNSIKALSIELGTNNVVSYERMGDFFNIITNNTLTISNGTLVNFLYEFGNKSKETINNLEENLLNSKSIYTDETGSKFNKKNIYVRNYSNNNTALYKANRHKGHKPIIDDNILPRFHGGIMGDHDTTLYSYGTNNYECNIHLGRYLEELIQNIPNILWAGKMKELIFRMNNTRKIAMTYGVTSFEKEKLDEYEYAYDKIILLAKEENKQIKSSYYKDKAKQLLNRLIKYKKNHLKFIYDFEIPFDNNLSEQDLRIFKIKTKVSGGFRSKKGIDNFVKALSIIKTSKKRNINPFDSIKRIFNNEILFAN